MTPSKNEKSKNRQVTPSKNKEIEDSIGDAVKERKIGESSENVKDSTADFIPDDPKILKGKLSVEWSIEWEIEWEKERKAATEWEIEELEIEWEIERKTESEWKKEYISVKRKKRKRRKSGRKLAEGSKKERNKNR